MGTRHTTHYLDVVDVFHVPVAENENPSLAEMIFALARCYVVKIELANVEIDSKFACFGVLSHKLDGVTFVEYEDLTVLGETYFPRGRGRLGEK